MNHCGHYEFDMYHQHGVERCCKCNEVWWCDGDPVSNTCPGDSKETK